MVEFIRKRDKRVAENRKKLEAKAKENQLKAEQLRRQQIEKRNKELENYCESEWSSMSALEEELKQIEERLDNSESKNNNSDDDEDDVQNNLYCIACDKAFKSDKAFANHENSKKHKTNVALLKSSLENEFNDVNS